MASIKTYSMLFFILCLLFCILAFYPFDEQMIKIGKGEAFLFLIATVIFLYSVNDLSKKLSKSLEEKEKLNSDLESLMLDIFKYKDLNSFVEDVVHNSSRIMWEDSFYNLIYERPDVCNLFIYAIRKKIEEKGKVFHESEKTNSDISNFALDLSRLNKFLQRFENISENQNLDPIGFRVVDTGRFGQSSSKSCCGAGVGISN